MRLQRLDRRTFVRLRGDDGGNGRLAIDADDGLELAIVGSDRDATPIERRTFRAVISMLAPESVAER